MTSAPVSDAGSPPPAAPAASPGLSPPAGAKRKYIKLPFVQGTFALVCCTASRVHEQET